MIGYATILWLYSWILIELLEWEKMVIKLKGWNFKITYIVAAYIPWLAHLVPTKSQDILLYSVVIMRNNPFFKIYWY